MKQTINFFDERGLCLGSFIELLKVPEFDEKVIASLNAAVDATEPTPIYWAIGFDKPLIFCGSPCTPKKALQLLRDALLEPDFVVIYETLLLVQAMEEKRAGGTKCH